jgi:hypothetical protein
MKMALTVNGIHEYLLQNASKTPNTVLKHLKNMLRDDGAGAPVREEPVASDPDPVEPISRKKARSKKF